jgi:DNA mismatch repair protein MutL
VFGKKLDQQLLTVQVETSIVRISGFISRPESSRKRGARQYFFVNGRYMRHPYFHKAVTEAYNRLIPSDEQVSYFLYFEIDPSNIDVNIHPTKTEVKFENESSIWQILMAAVKESLGKFNEMPTIDFDTEGMPNIPVYDQHQSKSVSTPSVHIDHDYNPFESTSSAKYARPKVDWEALYGGIEKAETQPVIQEDIETSVTPSLYNDKTADKGIEQLQIKGRFILTSVKSGLMVIDQRRAHIRILYDRYITQLKVKSGVSQRVLFPDVIQFPPSEEAILKQMLDEMVAIGFDLGDLGGGSYSINGVPAGTEGLDPVELVREMLHSALEKGNDVKEEVQHILALSLAKAAAIVHGQVLGKDEMTSLIDDLFACSTPNYTPDGHAVLTVIKEDEIEKRFE